MRGNVTWRSPGMVASMSNGKGSLVWEDLICSASYPTDEVLRSTQPQLPGGCASHRRDLRRAGAGEFLIAVGEGAHEKHRFQTGMRIRGNRFLSMTSARKQRRLTRPAGSGSSKMPRISPRLVHRFMACRLTRKPTAAGDIVVWTPGPMAPNSRAAFGAAGCRWK